MQKLVEFLHQLTLLSKNLATQFGGHEKFRGKRIPTFAFHINHWKRPILKDWFPDRKFIFVPTNPSEQYLLRKWLPQINNTRGAEILVWGMNLPPLIRHIATAPVIHIEDGFIRSIGLGSTHTSPLSLSADSRTPYFNAREASDLETILSTHNFDADPSLMIRSRSLLHTVLNYGLSKYNNSKDVDVGTIYGPKTLRRILVIGQVEDDASIKYGCNRILNNNDLVRIARNENPHAQIIYKPHPDVLHKRRAALSNPDDVREICLVLDQDIPLAQAFHEVDHVYTITSQSGFEALMRGIKVTALGCPFYAGWGLTDDRQPNPRRMRKLSLEQVFAAAYILYPKYFNYSEKRYMAPEEAVELLLKMRDDTTVNANPKKENSLPAVDKQPKARPPIGNPASGHHQSAEVSYL